MNPLFSNNGVVTEEGKAVIAHITETVNKTDKSGMNALPGYMRNYHLSVMAMRTMSAAEWLEDFRHSYAATAWFDVQTLQEAKKAQTEAQQTNAKLAESLEKLQADIEKLSAELAALKASPKTDDDKTPDEPTADADESEA